MGIGAKEEGQKGKLNRGRKAATNSGNLERRRILDVFGPAVVNMKARIWTFSCL